MAFSEFGGEQIGEFDLADLAFDFVVSHFGIEIMLEPILAQQLNEEFLGQVRVGTASAFFNQETSAPRCSHQRMMRNNAMQFRPEAIDV